jgi:quercetin dioxygenase-like cupin family protein
MFYKHIQDHYQRLLDGIGIETLVYGDRSLLSKFQLAKDSHLPRHSHPYEQTGYLLAGRMRLTVGNEVYEVEPGDSWCVPGHLEHQADILEDSVAIEVFSPVREDYLPENLAKRP